MRNIFLILFTFTIGYAAYFFSIGEPLFAFNNNVFAQDVIYVYEDTPLYIDIAYTDEEKMRGLGGRVTMAISQGMLFKFDTMDKWSIWMKDMNFGIDILWLDESGKVVDIKEYVYPDTYPEIFTPSVDAKYVLEVIAGYSSSHEVRIGHRFDLNGF